MNQKYDPSHPYIRLPLASYHNVRDIGGYAGHDNQPVRFGRFFRASEPVGLDAKDIRSLLDFPIHTFVDLRSEMEARRRPSDFSALPSVRYVRFSLLKPKESLEDSMKIFLAALSAFSLGQVYIHMLENAGDEIAGALTAMAEETKGACLYHCTHGKDRTGLITMLLYKLAGVADEDIIASYQVSFSYLRTVVDPLIASSVAESRHLLYSDADNMELLLDHFARTQVGIQDYLRKIGMRQEHIDRLVERLLGDPD